MANPQVLSQYLSIIVRLLALLSRAMAMIKNLGHRVPLTDVASIPVKEEPRDIPVISTNVVRIPQDYATIDEAIVAMAE